MGIWDVLKKCGNYLANEGQAMNNAKENLQSRAKYMSDYELKRMYNNPTGKGLGEPAGNKQAAKEELEARGYRFDK